MTEAVRNFLKDEDRASKWLIDVSVGLMALGLAVAVGAIVIMK